MLEFPHQKFLKTMIDRLRALMEKVDNVKEQVGNINKKMEILRKNQ